MKIALVCGNNGLPINGETTLAMHLYRFCLQLGHEPWIVSVAKSRRVKKGDYIPPKQVNLVHEMYKEPAKLEGYDKIILISTPYKEPLVAKMLLDKLGERYDYIMHGHTNIETMDYKLFAEHANRLLTNDAVLLNDFDAKFFRTPFFVGKYVQRGRVNSKDILVSTRMNYIKNPKDTAEFFKANPDYNFVLGDTSGMVAFQFFKDIPNVKMCPWKNEEEKKEAYENKKFALDLSKHVFGRKNLNYALLEPMSYGIVPIFMGDCVEEDIYGIDASVGTGLGISDEEYLLKAKQNRKIVEEEYGNIDNIKIIIGE